MADNVGYTPGTGATVAADDIGGVLHQRMKVSLGADGSATDLSSSNPMPVFGRAGYENVTTATLGALNATITISTAGAVGVVFVCEADATLVGSVRLEGSADGGVTWVSRRGVAGHLAGARMGSPPDVDGGDLTLGNYIFAYALSNIDDVYNTHYRLRVQTYTSGSVDMRAVGLQVLDWNQDGIKVVRLAGLDNVAVAADYGADGYNTTLGLSVGSLTRVFNGSSWDALRGDTLGLHVSRSATAATATVTSVTGSASSVTLLALNTARKGATIVNDSSSLLYVKLGTTASTTSYTVVLAGAASAPFAYYELPFGYTGRIDAIWASATGSARITELT